MEKKTSKKKNKLKRGCLGIFLIVIAAIVVFLFWPAAADDSIILSDSFDNNDNKWPLGEYSAIEDGQLICSEGDVSVIPSNIILKNGSINVELSYISGDKEAEFGIIFRDLDDEHYNYVFINAENSFMAKLKGNKDAIYDTISLIRPDESNLISIELYESLIRVYINEILIAESYDPNPGAGSIVMYSSGKSKVAFDSLEVSDFDKKDENLTGAVSLSGEPISGAEVIAYQVVEPATFGVVVIARMISQDNGRYSFYLPEDSSYFIEARTPDKKFIGDRYTDLQIPESGLELDITIREAE